MSTADGAVEGIRNVLRTSERLSGEAVVGLVAEVLQQHGLWHDGDEEAAYRRRQVHGVQPVVVEPSPEQVAYTAQLARRAELVRAEMAACTGLDTTPAPVGPNLRRSMGSGKSAGSRKAWQRAKFLDLAVGLVIQHPDWRFEDAYQQAARLLDLPEASSIHTVAVCDGGGLELTFEDWPGIGVIRAEFLRFRR